MARFTKIPLDTFDQLQMDAGILLTQFTPANPNVQDADIVTATTGGIHIHCTPTYTDMGEDVDNCPNGTKELQKLNTWDAGLETTAIGTSQELIRLSLGAADIDASTSKITPRKDLEQTDFADIWWVGDKAGGGFVAVRLINALSTNGFDLQTTKNNKGQVALTIRGFVSIADQETMPMEVYSFDS